jgi:integrase
MCGKRRRRTFVSPYSHPLELSCRQGWLWVDRGPYFSARHARRQVLLSDITEAGVFEAIKSYCDDDDKTSDTGKVRDHYEWSPEEISALISAANLRATEKTSRYDYGPMIHLIVLLGLRVGEAQALRVQDVDLLGGNLQSGTTGPAPASSTPRRPRHRHGSSRSHRGS